MSWPRQGSQNSLEKPKFERKSWISWDWGRACQGKLGGCPPPNLFSVASLFFSVSVASSVTHLFSLRFSYKEGVEGAFVFFLFL